MSGIPPRAAMEETTDCSSKRRERRSQNPRKNGASGPAVQSQDAPLSPLGTQRREPDPGQGGRVNMVLSLSSSCMNLWSCASCSSSTDPLRLHSGAGLFVSRIIGHAFLQVWATANAE